MHYLVLCFRSYPEKLEEYIPTFYKIRYILEELYVAVMPIISRLIIYIDQLNEGHNCAFTIKIHKNFGFPIEIWSNTCAKRGRKSNMEIRESFLWLIGNKWFLMTLIGAYQLSRASSILTGHRSSIKQFSIIKQFIMGKNNFRRNIYVIFKG